MTDLGKYLANGGRFDARGQPILTRDAGTARGEDYIRDLEAMLDHHCSYPEDVSSLAHFVFHPRMNGCSNVCLVCGQGADVDSTDGHATNCAYRRALERTASEAGKLQAHIEGY